MLRFVLITWLALCGVANAQLSGGLQFPGPGTAHSAASYVGPANLVASPFAWWGLRAMSAAKAGTPAINLCDDTGANCTDISTNASTGILNAPGTLGSNNCAATGTCKIKTFYDQSGNTNCSATACDMTQTTNSQRASFIANCLGSLPCADFNSGSTQEYTTANNVTATSQPISLSTVMLLPASISNALVFSDNSFNFQLTILNSNNIRLAAGGSNQDTAITANTSHAVQAVYNGASSDVNIDGTRTTFGSPGANGLGTAAAGKLNIGGVINMTAKMFEMGVWNSAFSAGNETSLCNNQFVFWGTATSC